MQNGKKYYYATDHLGSVTDLLDINGTNVASIDYSPYGRKLKQTGTVKPTFGYAGMMEHQPSGLNLTWYRGYDAKSGRWLSEDPIGFDGGVNLYGYGLGNPIKLKDVLGLDVYVCTRPADLPFPLNLLNHTWIKTNTNEVGMGGNINQIPAQNGNSDFPYTKTITVNHSGQSSYPDANCVKQNNVDEKCVDKLIVPGQSTGRWSVINQCQSFSYSTINKCRVGPQEVH